MAYDFLDQFCPGQFSKRTDSVFRCAFAHPPVFDHPEKIVFSEEAPLIFGSALYRIPYCSMVIDGSDSCGGYLDALESRNPGPLCRRGLKKRVAVPLLWIKNI